MSNGANQSRRSVDVEQLLSAADDSQWDESIMYATQWEAYNATATDTNQWSEGWEASQWDSEPPWWRRATRWRQLNSVTRRVATVKASRGCQRQDVRRLFSFQQRPLPEITACDDVGNEAAYEAESADGEFHTENRIYHFGGTVQLPSEQAPMPRYCSGCVCKGSCCHVAAAVTNGTMADDQLHRCKTDETNDDGMSAYPTYILPENNPLGDTDIEDLAELDRRKVRGLARLELAALFAKHRCYQPTSSTPAESKQRRFLSRRSRGQTQSTNDADKLDASETSKVEAKLNRLLRMIRLLTQRLSREDALTTRGLFRVSGSALRIRALRSAGPDVIEAAVASSIDPHDAAALLKTCLRELPRPLAAAPRDAGRFTCLPMVRDETDKLFGLNLLVLLLPSDASAVLRELVDLFAKVVAYRHKNQMTLQALATVTAPSLFPAQSPEQLLTDSHSLITAVEMLIKYRSIVWTVPDFTLRQLRRQMPPPLPPPRETSQRQPHAAVRLFRRIAGSSRQGQQQQQQQQQLEQHLQSSQPLISPLSSPLSSTSSSQSLLSPTVLEDPASATLVIAVRVGPADQASVVVKAVRLTPKTTAAEVVRRVGCESWGSLHEVGGNLTERRLRPGAIVTLVRKVNPGCSWWVK